MEGDFVIVVTDNTSGKIMAAKILQRSEYPTPDKYEKAIARNIDKLEREYKAKKYVIHQGNASNVSSFLTMYPEIVSA